MVTEVQMACDLADKCWWQLCFRPQVSWCRPLAAHCIWGFHRSLIFLEVAASLGQVFKMMTEVQVPLEILTFSWHPLPSTYIPLVKMGQMVKASINGNGK